MAYISDHEVRQPASVADIETTPILALPPDRFLACDTCSVTFVWTGWQQRQQAEPPVYCPGCRALRQLTRRTRGAVKWYDARKGIGFLTAADGSEVFVHRRALGNARSLRRGQVVAFRVEEGRAGPQAAEVERLAAGSLAESEPS